MTMYVEHKRKHTQAIWVSRSAVLTMFFINGAVFANWAARIPQVQANIGLTERSLGLALLGVSVGVLLALPLVGGLIARLSSRTVTIFGGLFFITMLPFIGWARSFWELWLALFGLGIGTSLMDVTMNAQAVEIERRVHKPIMSSFHAAFSVGGAAGAGMGALFASREIAPANHFMFVSLIFGILAIIASLQLVLVRGEQGANDTVFTLPPRPLWLLGIVAFAAAIGEGAMADWSALYLRQAVGVGEGLAGLGFAAFSLAMTVGRLSGDELAARLNPVNVVRYGGLIAASGLLLALLIPTYTATMIGFGVIGIGVATVIPLAFSAAGNREDISSSVGIAGVATIGYSGFLAGPPVIGIIAEETSLRLALSIVLVLFIVMAFAAGALRPQD